MTNRVRVLIVALEDDTRTDDVESLVNAISQLRGVGGVHLGEPTSPNDWATEQRVRADLSQRLWAVLHPKET